LNYENSGTVMTDVESRMSITAHHHIDSDQCCHLVNDNEVVHNVTVQSLLLAGSQVLLCSMKSS